MVVGIDVDQVELVDSGFRLDLFDGADGVGTNRGDVVLVEELAQAFLVEAIPGRRIMHRAAVVVGIGIDRLKPGR
ncbi:hypothetical protein D3C77_637410 [compost metagenome]